VTEYTTQAAVKKRATANGWRYLADRNRDGVVDATESAAVDQAVEWAGRRIDYALTPNIEPSDARSQNNAHLNDIAVDLATHRLFTNGGDDAPQSIIDAFDAAEEQIRRIKGGEAVPGLVIVPPYNAPLGGRRVPRAYMPRRRFR
jgi:hypothetical protein